jgi:hypothetical protein
MAIGEVPLRDAVARAGGFRIADSYISPLDLVAVGLLTAAEAERMQAFDGPADVGAPVAGRTDSRAAPTTRAGIQADRRWGGTP